MRLIKLLPVVLLSVLALGVGDGGATHSPPTLEISLPESYPGEMLHARWSHPTASSCTFDSTLDTAGPVTLGPNVDHHRFGPVVGPAPRSATATVDCQTDDNSSGGGTHSNITTISASVLPQPVIQAGKVGTFDTSCDFRHSAHDDPLVFPGLPGASHLHDFIGTRNISASSNGESLLLEGRADLADDGDAGCKDVGDHAGYWAPALWKLVNGVWVKMNPMGQPNDLLEVLHTYYRGNDKTVSFPVGFGMLSKDAGWACGDQQAQSFIEPVNCYDENKHVTMIVRFPHCWDGVHLFLPGNAHMSNARNCANAPGFPVELPRLTFAGLAYGRINNDNPPVQYEWRLGPNPDGSFNPASEAHADFLNAWEPFRLDQSIHLCHRQPTTPELNKLCHDDDRP